MRFDLGEGYYIRALDNLNWIVCKTIKGKEGNEYERIMGYKGDLAQAWNLALDEYVKVASIPLANAEELIEVIQRLERLKADVFTTKQK
jgi:hypothetical protein